MPSSRMPWPIFPDTVEHYASREQLEAGLTRLLAGVRRVAMEYSPGCAIPYIARVDAGTIELVRERGVEVVSSGNLVQRFVAVWGDAEIASHRLASQKLHRVKDKAFDAIAQLIRRQRRHDRVRDSASDGRMVRGGRPGERFRAERVGVGERR